MVVIHSITTDQGGHGVLCGESTAEWRDPEAAGIIGITPKRLHSLGELQSVQGSVEDVHDEVFPRPAGRSWCQCGG